MIRTTLRWELSPANNVVGYAARIHFNGKEQASRTFKVDESSMTIECPEKTHVVVLLAAVDGKGVTSKAQAYEFVASGDLIPAPPGPLIMLRTESVAEGQPQAAPVAAPTPATAPALAPERNLAEHIPAKRDPVMVMISGHPDLFDGAIGEVVEIIEREGQKGVKAKFATRYHHTAQPGQEVVMDLYPNKDMQMEAVLPDKSTKPLDQWIGTL